MSRTPTRTRAGFPITAWADRSPRTRYPILLLVLFLLWGLAGAIAPIAS